MEFLHFDCIPSDMYEWLYRKYKRHSLNQNAPAFFFTAQASLVLMYYFVLCAPRLRVKIRLEGSLNRMIEAILLLVFLNRP